MADDTISRRAAIDALDKRFDNVPMEQTAEILMLRKDLRELPSAQPEITEDDVKEYCRKRCLIVVTSDLYDEMMKRWSQPERKKGKWLRVGHWGRSYKCNQCGNFLDFDGVNAGRGDANFCPNCGADMREGDKA